MLWTGVLGGILAMMMGEVAPRPAGHAEQGRSVVMAKNGMVATSHPLAAEAGIEILRQGGNAVDAAIATCAVMGVVEPMSCGLGGDLFAIVWDAKTQKLYGLNASGRSPYAINVQAIRERGLDKIPDEGPLSWSVPGCVDGFDQLRQRFGTMTNQQLFAPAIRHAREGFPVVELIGTFWQMSTPQLARTPDIKRTFLPDGRPVRIGQLMTNPFLADTLTLIAEKGRDAFYRGSIAERIVRFSEAEGGLFSIKDFEDHTSTWVEPVSTNYRGYDVWELPPNGQGIAVLQMLNVLEGYDVKGMGHNSAEFLHHFVEAKKLAYEDRARFYADLDFNKSIRIDTLIGKEYGNARRALIDPAKAALSYPAGDSKLIAGDTIYLTVVDKDRNAVSLIQSTFSAWGSGLVPGDLGFTLQNRGSLFTLEDGHANRLEPHKRPFHTIIPAMVTKDGKPWLTFGVMGGDMQPQGHVQVLINMIDHGMNVQLAGEMARCRHAGSSDPTGGTMTDGGSVSLERGIPDEVADALRAMGHRVSYANSSGFGGYQAIMIDHELGTLHGATERRKDGAAVGY